VGEVDDLSALSLFGGGVFFDTSTLPRLCRHNRGRRSSAGTAAVFVLYRVCSARRRSAQYVVDLFVELKPQRIRCRLHVPIRLFFGVVHVHVTARTLHVDFHCRPDCRFFVVHEAVQPFLHAPRSRELVRKSHVCKC
jgi:hypothetical protein